MINMTTCNGSDLTGCAGHDPADGGGRRPPGTSLSTEPPIPYTWGSGTGPVGVAVFDANTCNATLLSGCSHDRNAPRPNAPFDARGHGRQREQHNYAANATNTISVFDGRTCDAS